MFGCQWRLCARWAAQGACVGHCGSLWEARAWVAVGPLPAHEGGFSLRRT